MQLPSSECAYSFSDLFFAAHERLMSEAEKASFAALTQEERNKAVQELAGLAGWKTREVLGTDSQKYLAFCPIAH